jgi:uncharacterized protein (TIGR03435 family)
MKKLLLLLTIAFRVSAQTQAFEVASVKPDKSGSGAFSINSTPGGRLTATNVTLEMLMAAAYDVQDFQIVGGPNWLNSDRFDVEARAAGNPDFAQLRPLLRTLLADRFRLKVHRDLKDVSGYALLVGKSEPKLRQNAGDPGPQGSSGRGRITDRKVSMSMFAKQLAAQLRQPVADRTGLRGDYDFKLEWSPGPTSSLSSESDSASLFTALQEQLGLRLGSAKVPVEVLVIDHAEKPTVH